MFKTSTIKLYHAALLLLLFACCRRASPDWPEYLGGPSRDHYSGLQQITPDNVSQLKLAWEYHTGDTTGQMQCNPIIVDGTLYATTASVQVFALNAATGQERWRFSAAQQAAWFNTNRGVVYWADGPDKRILFSVGPWLYALDAATGKVIPTFGQQGRVSLKEGLGSDTTNVFVVATTPGTIYKNLIIMGSRLTEGDDAGPGHIRAFDVRTGTLVWVFHTIPEPFEYGYATWPNDPTLHRGGANCWTGMSIDPTRGMLYVPTGSAAFDFYGGNRKGQNLYANCLLALDAATGKRIWHFQFVHHDLWDRDLPSPPTLLTIHRNGREIDAVAQVTKYGYVYVFDRVTGESLFPLAEIPVPQSLLVGEETWPTQPLPTKPAPYGRSIFNDEDINPYASNKEELLSRLRQVRRGHLYEPPSTQGTLIFPGFDGGAEWGGVAADPQGVLYVNANQMPWIHTMIAKKVAADVPNISPGETIYQGKCAACHGPDRRGNVAGNYPSLVDISKRASRTYVETVVKGGKGMMPSFSSLGEAERKAMVDFLFGEKQTLTAAELHTDKTPYTFDGYKRFIDAEGNPAVKPPWGTLHAIDLNTGEYRWTVPLGEVKALQDKGIPTTGTENYGGPVVTATGLLFIAATKDGQFRVFDTSNGQILWQTTLPACSFATPATYAVNGQQFIALACGGAKLGTKKGDSYVAYALPR